MTTAPQIQPEPTCVSYSKLLTCPTSEQGPAQRYPPFPPEHNRCLLVASATCHTWSLALQFAANNLAACPDPTATALVLGRRQALEERSPCLAARAEDQANVLSRVNISYLDTWEELQEMLGCLHLVTPTPHTLIVHDLGGYFRGRQDRREKELSRTLAYLTNAADTLRPPGQSPVCVLVTDEGYMQHDLCLAIRWLPLVLEVRDLHDTLLKKELQFRMLDTISIPFNQ